MLINCACFITSLLTYKPIALIGFMINYGGIYNIFHTIVLYKNAKLVQK